MDYQTYLFPIGTLMLSVFYLMAGINKLLNFKGTYESFSKKFSLMSLLSAIIIGAVVMIEIVAPAAMIYGANNYTNDYAKTIGVIGSWSLIVFTLLATLLYHFPPTQKEHRMPFMRNISLIGGFLIYIDKI